MKSDRLSPYGTPVFRTLDPKGWYRLRWLNPTTGDRESMQEHRWIWEQAYGQIPPEHDIHHINGNRVDNRLENLELLPHGTHTTLHHTTHGLCGTPQYTQIQYQKHRETRLAHRRRYHLEHLQEERNYSLRYDAFNRDKRRAYYRDHKEHHNQVTRAYYARNREKWQAYARRKAVERKAKSQA